ncbi:MAG: MarR family transcriptional regulator [bacterium]
MRIWSLDTILSTMDELEHRALIAQVEGIVDKILNVEKGHSFEIEGTRLYPSEIHLLLRIAAEPGINATGLAERLGLTKGAVSQTLSRLEKKGLLLKSRDAARKNELILEFTTLGRQTVEHFQGVQAKLRQRYDSFFASLSEADREVIHRFLSHLNGIFKLRV